MGLIHIMQRGGDDAMRFEEAMYDIKDAIDEACEIYEQMKSQFGDGEGYGERSSYRMNNRMNSRGGSMGERRSRRANGQYM